MNFSFFLIKSVSEYIVEEFHMFNVNVSVFLLVQLLVVLLPRI